MLETNYFNGGIINFIFCSHLSHWARCFVQNSVTKPRGAGCEFGLSLFQPLKYG